ncbi:MAG: DUF4012 domain-containing protein [Coriobacteriaceae bacterium]|nr:DUF4012 domain-containing protein [Coriobacteriaceae bacterium]
MAYPYVSATDPEEAYMSEASPSIEDTGENRSASIYTTGGSNRPYTQRSHTKRRRRIITLSILAIALIGAVASAGFVLLNDVKTVKNDALAIVDSATVLKDTLTSGSDNTLETVASDIDTRASRMNEITHGPLWGLATLVPVYGEDVRTVQTVASSLDAISGDVIVPLATSMRGMESSSLFTTEGAINVDALSTLADTLTGSKTTINQVAEDIDALPQAHIGQLQEALDKAKPLVTTLNDGVNVASEIAPYLPQMLGANGQTRTYIIVAQNNSELRATGGFAGATGTLTVTDGKIDLGEFQGVSAFGGPERGAIPVTEEEIALFGESISNTVQHMTSNPDFPATGQHVHDLCAQRLGVQADGVIAVDPTFLQNLLALTGGTTLPDGTTIDHTNAARVLLHDVYIRFEDPIMQDAYFALAADAAAGQIMGNLGSIDMGTLIKTISDNSKEGRLQVWMANPDEESAIARLGFAGSIGTDPTKPELGVYIHDETWAKMGWYLSRTTTVGEPVENADGTKTYQVTSTFKNNITAQEAEAIPPYIYGYSPLKRDRSDMAIKLFFYAPTGGSITNMQADADFAPSSVLSDSTYNGTQVTTCMIRLSAQQQATFTYTVTTPAEATEPLAVRSTPTSQVSAGWESA